MKRVIILILILSATLFGAYSAPNEDTVIVVGGLGTQADKNANNGGGATKSAWDGGSPSDFMGTNGAPVFTDDADGTSYIHATTTLNKTGIGTATTLGSLVYVFDSANITAGRYEVTGITDADNIVIAQADSSNDDTVSVRVGGALATLQAALDDACNDALTSNRYIYTNLAETISVQVDADQRTGAVDSHLIVKGYNAALTSESSVTLTVDADITSLLRIDGDVDYTEWHSLDFYAGGKDASKAEYAVYFDEANSTDHLFVNCKFRGAESHGLYISVATCNYHRYINCEAYDNGGSGFYIGQFERFIACKAHDNDSHGFEVASTANTIALCAGYDNGKDGAGDGFYTSSQGDDTAYINCTAFGNDNDDGFEIDDLADNCIVVNCASIGNGAHGYDSQGKTIEPFGYFGYNLAGGNTTDAWSEDTDFANARNGNNTDSTQTEDQLLETVTDGSEDLTPETSSDMLEAGIDILSTPKQDTGAIQYDATGGGGQPVIGSGVVR